jgi:hypothetical protein
VGGIIHPYYTVATPLAIAVLSGMGAAQLWRRDDPVSARILAGGVALTALTAYLLLSRDVNWLPWLGPALLYFGLAAAGLVLFAGYFPAVARRGVAVLALVVALAGSAAYSVATAAAPHSGAIPSAGPSASGFGGGGPGGIGSRPGGGGRGGASGLLGAATPGARLTSMLAQDSAKFTWVAASAGSNDAAGYQLATGSPVMAVGGFNGTDPYSALQQFQQHVHSGQIHYFLGSGVRMRGNSGGSDISTQIVAWVGQSCTAITADGTTVYDLTA